MKTIKPKKLKMYVWTGVLEDYYSGMMVVLAPDLKTARNLLRKELKNYENDIMQKPIVVSTPKAFYVHGGG